MGADDGIGKRDQGHEYGDYVPRKLTGEGSDQFGDEAVGDLCYYAPWGNLAMFHGPYRWSRGLIRLGRLDGGPAPLLVRGEHPLRIEILS